MTGEVIAGIYCSAGCLDMINCPAVGSPAYCFTHLMPASEIPNRLNESGRVVVIIQYS